MIPSLGFHDWSFGTVVPSDGDVWRAAVNALGGGGLFPEGGDGGGGLFPEGGGGGGGRDGLEANVRTLLLLREEEQVKLKPCRRSEGDDGTARRSIVAVDEAIASEGKIYMEYPVSKVRRVE